MIVLLVLKVELIGKFQRVTQVKKGLTKLAQEVKSEIVQVRNSIYI